MKDPEGVNEKWDFCIVVLRKWSLGLQNWESQTGKWE